MKRFEIEVKTLELRKKNARKNAPTPRQAKGVKSIETKNVSFTKNKMRLH